MCYQSEEVHAIPLWLLREYLKDLGGTADDEHTVVGEGWTAKLIQLRPKEVGSLRVGQVKVAFSGRSEAISQLRTQFHKKTIRAGA
ncbi:MAG: hypothetical protein CSA11_06405 [Chloroflexi bacterium]|nr:MAG: hypothetical protein CSB13_02490 [Chloroflexota bacterium]PIE80854.1 MAG: hypothetical protein CSA11_06405 [Chloroflexota bacterium]